VLQNAVEYFPHCLIYLHQFLAIVKISLKILINLSSKYKRLPSEMKNKKYLLGTCPDSQEIENGI
jgi:hypothetical protein